MLFSIAKLEISFHYQKPEITIRKWTASPCEEAPAHSHQRVATFCEEVAPTDL